MGLRVIGEIVGRTRREEGGLWPRPAFVEVLEPWLSEEAFCEGLHMGLVNAPGAAWRAAEAGNREREKAEKFKAWRREVELSAPRLAALFDSVAQTFDRWADREIEEAAFRRAAPD